jgi:hypothetical protein
VTTTDTFEGRPIQGDLSYRDFTAVEQWDRPRFLELLDAVLAAPDVSAVRWRQWVPSFNDGDPCEFTLDQFYLRPGTALTIADTDPEDVYDDDEDSDYGDGFVDHNKLIRTWDNDARKYVDIPNPNAGAEPLQELNKHSGHFESVLRESFGDHAIITATRDGFRVELYEHD